MSSLEKLKKYLDYTKKILGVEGGDIHLWLESQPKHLDLSFNEALKLEKKVKDKFSEIYGETLAWSIAFSHILLDYDANTRETLVLETVGDKLLPKVKTVKEAQDDMQKYLRQLKAKGRLNSTL